MARCDWGHFDLPLQWGLKPHKPEDKGLFQATRFGGLLGSSGSLTRGYCKSASVWNVLFLDSKGYSLSDNLWCYTCRI